MCPETIYRILKVGERPLHITQNKRTTINVGKLIPTKEGNKCKEKALSSASIIKLTILSLNSSTRATQELVSKT